MADQINDSTEKSISSSDNELEKGSHYWTTEFQYKDNNINENDWSSSDDDDDDDSDGDGDGDGNANNDKEITDHHKEPSSLKNLNWDQVPDFIRNMCWDQVAYHICHSWKSMNRYERRQACYYKAKLLSIRRQLTNNNLILRPIYKGTGYHLDSIHTFQNKVSQFMTQTSSYSLVFKLSRSYSNASQTRLANIVERVETTLDNLFRSKSITETQYMTMKINRLLVRMNYLYFVSDTHKVCIFFVLFILYFNLSRPHRVKYQFNRL
jgi:hypothetical protein